MIRIDVSRGFRHLKALLGWMMFASGEYRRRLRGRAIIVLFHRIDDNYPDNPITCTRAEFERFVRFFTKYFEVVPLSGLLDSLANGKDLSRRLTITFDDGYRDNATIAAPILERHGARACFFLATKYVGSEDVPPWDKKRGIRSEWMSWDQVRALHHSGHEVGAHTVTHVDLGIVRGDAARAEIEGARNHIAKELGERPSSFAYPFGRADQMVEENVELVMRAGFTSCLSAFGGTVHSGNDSFHLRRTAITPWFVSPYQFGFELVTGRLDRA